MGKIYKDNGNDFLGDSKACEMTSECYCIDKRAYTTDGLCNSVSDNFKLQSLVAQW